MAEVHVRIEVQSGTYETTAIVPDSATIPTVVARVGQLTHGLMTEHEQDMSDI